MLIHRLLNVRVLIPLALIVALAMVVACGSAEEPTEVPATAAPEATSEPAPAPTDAPAPSGQQPTSAPADTPVPDATIRPTNTPAPTATQVVARPTPVPEGGPKYGGTVNMSAYADSRDWDPKGSSSLSSIQAVSQLYNQLVQYDTVDTSLIVCDLCESWEFSDGGETVTFHLRPGVQWLDGTPLTADDVHNSMLRYGDLDSKMGRSGLWRQYTDEAKSGGVNLIDNETVEFNLKFASGAFIKFLAVDYVKVLPKHLLDQGIDLNLAESVIDNRSGSGPFVLDEYQRGSFYKVSKNPNYFKEGRPYFDAIDHTIIVDPSVLIAQITGGQIDMSNGGFTNMTPTQVFELERDSDGAYRGVAVQPTADWGLMLNVKKEPFNDARVRKAIALAIDYQQWNDLVFDNTSGVGCPLMGLAHSFEECLTWPGLRPKDTPDGEADVAKAKELMAAAGLADGFETRMDVRQVGTYPEQCSVVKDQLEKTLNIRVTDFQTYPSAAGYDLFATSRPADQPGDWELACQGEGQVVLDVDGIMGGVYLKGATRNYTDWENEQVNAWHEQQKQETDPERRREINKEMEAFLFTQDDNHWITLGWGVLQWVVGEQIKDFHAPQTVQTHFKHEDLWLER
jgi:peptide/nickel transport system substrate-binding protein